MSASTPSPPDAVMSNGADPAGWIVICTLEDIPPLGARVVNSARGDLALFRCATDEIFALLDRCPHKGGPISQGIVHGTSVTCPLHNWTISLQDGNAAPPDEGCVTRYEVKVDAGTVSILL